MVPKGGTDTVQRPRAGGDDLNERLAFQSSAHSGGQPTPLELTAGERAKLEWLLGLVRGLDSAQKEFNGAKSTTLLNAGVALERTFDWRIVQNRCMPELAIVMVGDAGKNVYDWPQYAVIPRLGIHVDLQTAIPVEKAEPEQTGNTLAMLTQLQHQAHGLSPSKRSNAEHQLTILSRIFGVGTLPQPDVK